MRTFLQELKTQRWDDHRYYHHSRINQSLHFVSALSFLLAYAVMFVSPAIAALIGWLVSMLSRQSGHFFFEPRGYDHVNQATHEYKEEIKVGYNLQRKVVLMALWALAPLLVYAAPDLFGLLEQPAGLAGYALNVGWVWFYLGVAGLLFRMFQLFWLKDARTGVVWVTKILTDPFHDIALYHKAPWQLLKGEFFDPHALRQQHG